MSDTEKNEASQQERLGCLVALNRVKPEGAIYAGSVTAKTKARRRARGQAAKMSRRANR